MKTTTTYHSFEELPLVMCPGDLARVLGIGRNQTYILLHSGQIRSIRVGVKYLIPRDAVVQFMSSGPAA